MKRPQTKATKAVTLNHVVSRASKDKGFLSSLLKAPVATLKNHSLKLSAADGKKLKTLIAKTGSVKGKSGLALAKKPPCKDEADWAPIP